MMQLATQLSIFVANKPGTLARVAEALTAAGVGIQAISTSDTIDHNVVRLIVSDTARALQVFHAHGALVVENEVLLLTVPNKPGSLEAVARKLGDGGVNIEYCYGSGLPEAKKGLMVLRVDNARKALKLLNT